MNNSSTTRADVLLLGIALVMLACLIFPALAQSGADADQATCLNKLKNLAIAMLNHHDTKKMFPLASTQPIDHKPGSTDAESAAGSGWLAMLLPFIDREYEPLYKTIYRQSRETKPVFSSDFTASHGGKSVHPAAAVIDAFICPTFKSDPHVSADDSDYQPLADDALPAVSNYNAFAGSHFVNAEGLGRFLPADKLAAQNVGYEGNGAMPFPGVVAGKTTWRGLGIQSFVDGTSNTVAIAETIEPAYSAWLDGQSTWLVAAWPGNETIPTASPTIAGAISTSASWSDEDKKTSKVAVNLRNADGSPVPYLAVGRWSGSKERRYAASSNHAGGVGHAYVDGHVEVISADVDPNVYLHLVTRAGREIIPTEFKEKQAKTIPAARPEKPEPGPRLAVASHPPSAIQVIPGQWSSSIEWSPLPLGDLRLSFPQLISTSDFQPLPGNPSVLRFTGKSDVFSLIVFDTKKREFLFAVSQKEAATAMPKFYRQLRGALGEPAAKEVEKQPKRVTWKKDAKWPDGAASFEFVLTESDGKMPATVVIRVNPSE